MMKLDELNDMQKCAVKHTQGPLLIIAGAGSGKTRVLTYRIAYLIEECGVNPYHILAITFTNKAASEMKERVENIIDCGNRVWVSTFHSTCVRILRRYIDRIGYDNNFTIYDTDDQKSVIKEVCKKLNIDTKMLKERTIMSVISRMKDEHKSPDDMEREMGDDYNIKRIAMVYREYQKTLKQNNALDFDDLIFMTVDLFEKDREVLDFYQEKFKYIMVDEYQDTNTIQFQLISLLAGKYQNLCVVGDDDQSIYKFRGANIKNILNFESVFENAMLIKLEQNYRSTKTILDAANAVIANNVGRKSKNLWTENDEGDKIHFCFYEDGFMEAEGVVDSICAKVRDGWNYNDIAILYRTNAQSRMLEEKLIFRNVPYRIYGGINFYQRKEIKDILAYLKTIDNGSDAQAVKRIINVPKRGIGQTTIDKIQSFADLNDCTFWDALCNADQIPDIGRALNKLQNFVTLILGFKAKLKYMSIRELTDTIIEDIKYYEYLSESETGDEVEARQENIDELINKIVIYESQDGNANENISIEDEVNSNTNINAENGIIVNENINIQSEVNIFGEEIQNENRQASTKTLSAFLAEVALISDIDNLNQNGNQVMLMTLHSAKGLEFPIVYMTGLEDGLFPSYMSITSDDPMDVEEERRLCYVGITRAQNELTITGANVRMIRGEAQLNKVSRFVQEIPHFLLKIENVNNKNTSLLRSSTTTEKRLPFNTSLGMNGKAAASRYSSGNTANYNSYNPKPKSKSTGLGLRAKMTNYGSLENANNTNNLQNTNNVEKSGFGNNIGGTMNKKVGFGKEFPKDISELKKIKSENFSLNPPINDSSFIGLNYKVGDMVIHVKFGKGIVQAIEEKTKDYMVTVDFEDFGIKKMLAGFAQLKKM